jgi:putative ribosome biogenesis GTPase RsgA
MPVTLLEFQLAIYLLLRPTACLTASSFTILRANDTMQLSFVSSLTVTPRIENHCNLKFLLEIEEGNYDAIITYNKLCDLLEQQEEQQDTNDPDTLWTYDDILGHQGPIKPNNPFYK